MRLRTVGLTAAPALLIGGVCILNAKDKIGAKQHWESTTSGEKIPVGWEPFAYDSNDEVDPFLLRRRVDGKWDAKQKWEIKTSGEKIPEGWEPFAYDSNSQLYTYQIPRPTTSKRDRKQQ